MSYVPARFAAGHVEPHLVGLQLAWLAVALAGATAVFATGERRLQIAGG
jgi:hypothetical protein